MYTGDLSLLPASAPQLLTSLACTAHWAPLNHPPSSHPTNHPHPPSPMSGGVDIRGWLWGGGAGQVAQWLCTHNYWCMRLFVYPCELITFEQWQGPMWLWMWMWAQRVFLVCAKLGTSILMRRVSGCCRIPDRTHLLGQRDMSMGFETGPGRNAKFGASFKTLISKIDNDKASQDTTGPQMDTHWGKSHKKRIQSTTLFTASYKCDIITYCKYKFFFFHYISFFMSTFVMKTIRK